jgi:Carboxypeptidase regulatory-like domain
MNSTMTRLLIGIPFSFLWVASAGLAQTTFGSISGTVSDPSGAVVPRATVTVTNEGTGIVRRVTTGSAGDFNAPDLDVGSYRIHVAATGFAVYERGGLVLSAHQVINLNVSLALASTATVTQVTSAAPIIDTSNATLSGIVTGKGMEQVPLVSRHHADSGFYDFMLLNAGTAQVPDNGSGATINGTNQASGQLVAIDGIALMRNTSGYGAGEEQPSFDAVQELNVITSNAPAEFAAPVATTEVTKGGTNQFHGAVFETYNGNALDTRDFFSPNIPGVVYNDFGANLGGPIQKNKTFFYFSFEGSRTGSEQLLLASVPLPAWRNGDLSSLLSQGITLINPATGAPFPNNQIPSNLISPVSQKVDNLYPLPNFGPPGTLSNNYRQNFPGVGTTVWDVYDGRVDHNFGTHDTIFGRFDTRRVPQTYTNVVPSIGHEFQVRNGFSSVFSWTHIFAPTVVNEFRVGYVRGRNLYYPDTVGSNVIQQVGIQGVSTSGIHNVPIFDITGVTPIDMDAACDSFQDHLEQNYEYIDNLVWTAGRHAMKFGFDAIHDQVYGARVSSNIYGQYSFPGVYTGFGYGDFLLGIPQTTTLGLPTPYNYIRGTVWGLYGQDEFKVNTRLTLNYGVRWDIEPPYQDKNGEIYSFDPKTGSLVVPDNGIRHINPFFPTNIPIVTASQAGYPGGSLIDFHADDIRPRIGFAYAPSRNGKTVIRGGFGIYSNLIYSSIPVGMTGGPFSGSATYINSITNGVPLFSFPDPFLSSGTSSTENIQGVNPTFSPPYTEQWNFTAERQLGNLGVRASYVGTHAVNLLYQRNLNQPPPSLTPFSTTEYPYQLYDQITWVDSGATQDFNALEVSATKSYGKNLTFNSGWTWARDLTDAGPSTSPTGTLIQNAFDLRAEMGNNLDTPTHRVFGYATYTLPFGRGQHWLNNTRPVVQAFLGGWNTSWNTVVQSGEWFTPMFAGFDPSNTGVFGGRPDRIGNGKLSHSTGQTIYNWFNVSAFKIPGCPNSQPLCSDPTDIGQFGNSGVDILRGPRLFNFDFALMKNFPLGERFQLQFRANMVNALNHPNFYQPDPDISDVGTVGTVSGTTTANGLGEPTTREIDLWLKLQF